MNLKQKDRLRELVVYVIFGVLTTLVALGTYFLVLEAGYNIFDVTDESSPTAYAVRVVAQVLHWIAGVLFAFFTNKKWVFTNADQNVSVRTQLMAFAGSRLVTLGLDSFFTFGTVAVLNAFDYKPLVLLRIELSADFISKVVASVVVIITNYILSKLFVFKDKKEKAE